MCVCIHVHALVVRTRVGLSYNCIAWLRNCVAATFRPPPCSRPERVQRYQAILLHRGAILLQEPALHILATTPCARRCHSPQTDSTAGGQGGGDRAHGHARQPAHAQERRGHDLRKPGLSHRRIPHHLEGPLLHARAVCAALRLHGRRARPRRPAGAHRGDFFISGLRVRQCARSEQSAPRAAAGDHEAAGALDRQAAALHAAAALRRVPDLCQHPDQGKGLHLWRAPLPQGRLRGHRQLGAPLRPRRQGAAGWQQGGAVQHARSALLPRHCGCATCRVAHAPLCAACRVTHALLCACGVVIACTGGALPP